MIGLIACAAQKLDRAAPARDLYCSPLFRKSLAYVEQHCATVYVLSALHGLVALDTVIAPYDQRLSGSASAWGRRVLVHLEERHGPGPVTILAGQVYANAVIAAARAGSRWAFIRPLGNKMIGPRLRWLNEQLREGRHR